MKALSRIGLIFAVLALTATSFADALKRMDIPESKASFLIFEELAEPEVEEIEDKNPFATKSTSYVLVAESESYFGTFSILKGKAKIPNAFLGEVMKGIFEEEPGEGVEYKITSRQSGKFGKSAAQTYKRNVKGDGFDMVEMGLVVTSEDGLLIFTANYDRSDSEGKSEAEKIFESFKYDGASFGEAKNLSLKED